MNQPDADETIDYNYAQQELMMKEYSNDPISEAISAVEQQYEEDKQGRELTHCKGGYSQFIFCPSQGAQLCKYFQFHLYNANNSTKVEGIYFSTCPSIFSFNPTIH